MEQTKEQAMLRQRQGMMIPTHSFGETIDTVLLERNTPQWDFPRTVGSRIAIRASKRCHYPHYFHHSHLCPQATCPNSVANFTQSRMSKSKYNCYPMKAGKKADPINTDNPAQ